ncbi:hypothetical protein MXD81_14550, partial [Microbacteriaceae bacterium K1510]|nr:hypothetical protein [Microbacteriaceae bacterium K1510]
MLFLGDTWKPTSYLTFDFGLKHTIINRDTYTYLPDAKPYQNELNDEVTLPTAGVKLMLNRENH